MVESVSGGGGCEGSRADLLKSSNNFISLERYQLLPF